VSLSKKIFIFSCFTLLFIILPLFYIAKSALTQFGTYAYDVNEKQIKHSSQFYLSAIAEERAKTYDEIFKKIKTATALMGSGLSTIYFQEEQLGKTDAKRLTLNPDSGLFFSGKYEPVVKVYWGGDRITPAVEEELNLLERHMPMLMKAKENVAESLATHVITMSGIGLYYTTNSKAKSACFNLPGTSQFDLRQGEPVTMFTRSKIRHFDTHWTRIYKDDVIDDLMMTASAPVYDEKKQFRGITGIDIPVGYIIRDLIGDNSEIGASQGSILFSFLVNKGGQIIAFPKEYLACAGLDIDMTEFKNSSDIFNYSLADSKFQSVRELTGQIDQLESGLIEILLEDKKFLLGVGRLTSVGWHLVCVAKESDMTISLEKTGIALEKSLTTIWKEFLGHSTLILVVSLLSIFCAIKFFVSPIREFIAATRKISQGDFSLKIDSTRDDEIGQLARSFKIMTQKLQASELTVKQNSKELEERIQFRTKALEKSNSQLNQIKNSLEKIIAERTIQLRKLNEHLVYTEESERRAIASDLHDSVTQTLAMCISKLKDIREVEGSKEPEHLQEVQVYIEQSVREIRSLIYRLSPPILDDFDIEIALGFLIEKINEKHDSQFSYVNHIDVPIPVDHAIKVTIYRAVSELITNILKHAGTLIGNIEISYASNEILLNVSDKGAGFDTNAVQNQEIRGFGLNSLSERIQNFGGVVTINAAPGVGTDICLTVPVRMNKEMIT